MSTHAAGTQRGTPLVTASAREASRKLADYLPARVVQGMRDAGFTRDLYPWQVRNLFPLFASAWQLPPPHFASFVSAHQDAELSEGHMAVGLWKRLQMQML